MALGDGLVAGFIALAPATDADSDDGTLEIVALEVDPLHTRRGHGSRLLAAAADTARGLGGHRLQVWLLAGDDPREQLLTTAGLGRDGASRERALAAGGDGNTLREVRLSAWLRDPEPDHRPAPGPDGESEVGT